VRSSWLITARKSAFARGPSAARRRPGVEGRVAHGHRGLAREHVDQIAIARFPEEWPLAGDGQHGQERAIQHHGNPEEGPETRAAPPLGMQDGRALGVDVVEVEQRVVRRDPPRCPLVISQLCQGKVDAHHSRHGSQREAAPGLVGRPYRHLLGIEELLRGPGDRGQDGAGVEGRRDRLVQLDQRAQPLVSGLEIGTEAGTAQKEAHMEADGLQQRRLRGRHRSRPFPPGEIEAPGDVLVHHHGDDDPRSMGKAPHHGLGEAGIAPDVIRPDHLALVEGRLGEALGGHRDRRPGQFFQGPLRNVIGGDRLQEASGRVQHVGRCRVRAGQAGQLAADAAQSLGDLRHAAHQMSDAEQSGSLRQERFDGARMPVEIDLAGGRSRQGVQAVFLLRGQRPGPDICHAQRADGVAVGRAQRHAREEADVRGPRHQGVLGRPRVGEGVLDDEGPVNGQGAQAHAAGQFGLAETDLSLEPGALRVDETHHGERCGAELGGQADHVVKGHFRSRVEETGGAQRRHARRLRTIGS
jgi:hypothetical protein